MSKEVENKKHILIAEDDSFYATIYTERLTQLGYKVDVASNGEELLTMLKTTKPDLVMLDVIMPKMDGFEVLKKIRSQPENDDLKILMLSNLRQNEDVEKAKELGATDYIFKGSTSIHEIIDKINSLIRGN